jgi:hypothetical protein
MSRRDERPGVGVPRFAHRAERALARTLSAHGIRWLYEPHTFVLERSADGTVRRAFTPDFYLPDVGLYLECTMARRCHTTRKRSKARAARRLYGIVVEIVYRTDFETLARRWSLHELERALDEARVRQLPGPSHSAAGAPARRTG